MDDRRDFARYNGRSACEIRIDGTLYNGFVVDSSDGLGVIVENAPLFKKGSLADIRTLSDAMEMRAKVAWAREVGGNIRVGFDRIGNLKGNLKNYKLPDLLIGIQRGTKTGVLKIVSESVVKQIYIRNGDMVFAESSFEDDRLGEMLLREGRITVRQFNEASKRLVETGDKLGRILVEMSCMTPHELYQAVQRQVNEIILSLFTLEAGAFEFREGPPNADNLITLIISAANIIYRGIKRIESFVYVKQMCPSPEAVLDVSQHPMNIFQSITLEHTDMEILSLINGKHHLKDILTLSPVTDFETLKTIASFFRIGIVTTKEKGEAPSMVSAGDVMEEKADEAPAEFLEKVEELYDQCESLEYYLFLGVDAQAGADEIQKAYYNISKQYHPDRHFDFPEHDIKGKLIRISAYATEAHTMLSDPARRERYYRELSEEARSATDEAATDHASSGDVNITGKVRQVKAFKGGTATEGVEQESQEGSNSHYELGCAYMEMGLSDEAIKEFRIASSDPSRKTRCTTAVAECLADKGEHQNAIEELRNFMSELSADQEEYQEAKYALADIYEKKSDYGAALELYNEIYSHDAGYRDVARKVGTIRSML